MSEQKYSLDTDLKEAKAMADGLIPYVYEDELYGRVGFGGMFSGGSMPSLTLGALLMRLRRLHSLEDRMTDSQRRTLAQIEERNAEVRKEWRVHYDEKLLREANSRLDAMRTFFEECSQSPRQCAGNYMPEALRRTIVQELYAIAESVGLDTKPLREKMHQTDSRLRGFANPTEFIWDANLQAIYPKDSFWWLYARPRDREK